jgi:hypothetical protein
MSRSRYGTARHAIPPAHPASTPSETAKARTEHLRRLHIESCRRHPQTCVQPPSDGRAASATGTAR